MFASLHTTTTAEDERRFFPRREIQERIESLRLDHAARHEPHVSLALRNVSAGGLSALSDLPLSSGERIALFFPPQGAQRGWDARGRVLRCDPSACGYHIAVEFDRVAAAA
jgi:hypothetical protein